MTLETHTVERCANCGAERRVNHYVSIVGDRLSYSVSSRCDVCGNTIEADGGDLPDEVRGQLLRDSGRWQVVLHNPGTNKLGVVAWLHHKRGLDRRDALAMASNVPSVVIDGLSVEAELARRELAALGADVVVSRVE